MFKLGPNEDKIYEKMFLKKLAVFKKFKQTFHGFKIERIERKQNYSVLFFNVN